MNFRPPLHLESLEDRHLLAGLGSGVVASTLAGQQTSYSTGSSSYSQSYTRNSGQSSWSYSGQTNAGSGYSSYPTSPDSGQTSPATPTTPLPAIRPQNAFLPLNFQAAVNVIQVLERGQASNLLALQSGAVSLAGQFLTATAGLERMTQAAPTLVVPPETWSPMTALAMVQPNTAWMGLDRADKDAVGVQGPEAQTFLPLAQDLPGLPPAFSAVVGGTLPVDWPALSRAADQFFARLDSLGQDPWQAVPLLTRLAPWLVLSAVAPLTLEMLRWRLKNESHQAERRPNADDPRWAFWPDLFTASAGRE